MDGTVFEAGIEIVAKRASQTGVVVWVGACVPDAGEDHRHLGVRITFTEGAGGRAVHELEGPLERYRFTELRSPWAFYHNHFRVPEGAGHLRPGTRYRVTVTCDGPPGTTAGAGATFHDWCTFTTLPEAVTAGVPLEVVAASCYDLNTDPGQELPTAFESRYRPEDPPHMTILCGDQVYLDAPWYRFRWRAARRPRPYYLQKYWANWGMMPRSLEVAPGRERATALRPVLQTGANWFLPDDHEIWNNFPHGTPMVLHSLRNEGKIIWHRLLRLARRFRGQWPPSLVEPPCALEWEEWSRGAFELFASFQTPSDGVSRGIDDPPEPPHEPGRCPFPFWTDPVQVVDVEPVRFLMLDTRTRRTRSARAPTARFIAPGELDRALRLAAEPSAAIVVLVLAQPLFIPPVSYDSRWKVVRAYLDPDRGLENYHQQYRDLWHGLIEARAGRPTVVVGGDVHYSRISLAPELSMLEVIASPMSEVEGLASIKPLLKRTRRVLSPILGPVRDGSGVDLRGIADTPVQVIELQRTDGLASLRLRRAEGTAFELSVEIIPRVGSGFARSFRLDPAAAPGPTITVA